MKHLLSFVLMLGVFTAVFAQNLPQNFKQKPQKSAELLRFKGNVGETDGTQNPQRRYVAPASALNGLRARVVRDSAGLPVYIEYAKKLGSSPQGRVALTAAAMRYLQDLKSVLPLKNPTEESQIESIEDDELAYTHIRVQQQYKGVPVYGGEYMLHLRNDEIQTLNGRIYPTPTLADVSPSVSESAAITLAINALKKETVVRNLTENEKQFIKKYTPESELLIYHPNEDLTREHLAWKLTIKPNFIERWVLFIDAKTGNILYKNNHTCAIDGPAKATATDLNGARQNLNVYLKGSTYYLLDITRPMFKAASSTLPNNPVGGLWTVDARNSTADDISIAHITSSAVNTWTPTAVSAHYNAGLAYEYFSGKFGRNSLDGKGGTIISVINIKDEDGKDMGNAFWNGEIMGYGNGDGFFKPLAGGLDVAAHELTHGVVENTCNLEYQGQSGAINESLADVFGVLVDRTNWTIGEQVVKPGGFPSGALRSLSNPNQGGTSDPGYQPRTMSQYVNTSQDNGGVHINSGIPNYAFYLFANNANVGRDKAEKIYYRAMTVYLTRSSKFLSLRLAVVKAATDLHGATSAEVTAAKAAFDAVGILDSSTPTPTTPPANTIPENKGTDQILVYSADERVYSITPTSTTLTPKITRKILQKPSVTDDGQTAYYVSTDNQIRSVNLTGTPAEFVVSDQTIWENVAVSRDGKKLAALTTSADKSLYVYSYDLKKWNKFKLYNPTYSKGVTTGDVQYADAIEWDQSGEYVVYDAFNKLKSLSGEVIDYWDVGFIKVWDGSTNTFGDGSIEKLFSNLDKGESVGNPSFSKNSPNIIAFDYFNENDDSYAVLGADIENGNVEVILKNNTLGTPNYARLDDKLLFVTKSGTARNVNSINLNKDKITANSSTSTLFVRNATWPVWYAQGTRELPTIAFTTVSDKLFGTPPFQLQATHSGGLPVLFKVVSGPATIVGTTVTLTGVGTVVIRAYAEGNSRFAPAAAVERSFVVGAILSIPITTDQLTVFPNPATGRLQINGITDNLVKAVLLKTTLGSTIATPNYDFANGVLTVELPPIPTNTFVIEIQTDKTIFRKKMLKQ